jgi:hypothetical protein
LGKLAVDQGLFNDMIETLEMDHQLQEFVIHFRLMFNRNDFAHPPCVFSPLFSGSGIHHSTPQGFGEYIHKTLNVVMRCQYHLQNASMLCDVLASAQKLV